ncbi:MAG TPA: cytidine deaminase [Aggregatilineales bacterium]|nr:cytidine deaminase [Aggregatilineales bacterium]
MTDSATQQLIERAITASQNAYAPYSGYYVGAALLAENGKVFTGCNVENATYPAGICAERTALVKAISEGVREFSTIVVVTRAGGTPCGICRQMLYEFSPNLRVIIADMAGEIYHDMPLTDLLPYGFSGGDLRK